MKKRTLGENGPSVSALAAEDLGAIDTLLPKGVASGTRCRAPMMQWLDP